MEGTPRPRALLRILYAVAVLAAAYGTALLFGGSTFVAILVIAAGVALGPRFGERLAPGLLTAALLVCGYVVVSLLA